MAGPAPDGSAQLPGTRTAATWRAVADDDPGAGLRIAVSEDLGFAAVDPEVRAAFGPR